MVRSEGSFIPLMVAAMRGVSHSDDILTFYNTSGKHKLHRTGLHTVTPAISSVPTMKMLRASEEVYVTLHQSKVCFSDQMNPDQNRPTLQYNSSDIIAQSVVDSAWLQLHFMTRQRQAMPTRRVTCLYFTVLYLFLLE